MSLEGDTLSPKAHQKDPGQTSTFVLATSVVGTEITDVQLYI